MWTGRCYLVHKQSLLWQNLCWYYTVLFKKQKINIQTHWHNLRLPFYYLSVSTSLRLLLLRGATLKQRVGVLLPVARHGTEPLPTQFDTKATKATPCRKSVHGFFPSKRAMRRWWTTATAASVLLAALGSLSSSAFSHAVASRFLHN